MNIVEARHPQCAPDAVGHGVLPDAAGALAYVSIPKEAEPDVQIPIIYVSLGYQGISPEDSERLLLRPMETRLKSLSDVKEMRSTAYQGGGNVLIEFQAGADLVEGARGRAHQGLGRQARPAAGADEPTVNEVNISEFPVLVVTLSGDVPERALTRRRASCATGSRKCQACSKPRCRACATTSSR